MWDKIKQFLRFDFVSGFEYVTETRNQLYIKRQVQNFKVDNAQTRAHLQTEGAPLERVPDPGPDTIINLDDNRGTALVE